MIIASITNGIMITVKSGNVKSMIEKYILVLKREVKQMEELIKSIVQSEGYTNAIFKGYVVRTWKSYKDGHGEVVNVRMTSDHYATETFFGVKANRNFVKERVMYLYQSVVNYYNDRFE